ncbi:hypothetical protein HNP84_000228 [Thermocatellispora tengchongensis]|uniref:Phage tail protein n=1 Tax=Thermocatellispora tengchongensis TaxID=1073253 RepID=A0A840NZF9_9ACTN|nr:radical SAM protein [Thermocatellispora tengchongensis]MBB5130540.1 hypothetical protein [Thermocatellispora tengchongensis]
MAVLALTNEYVEINGVNLSDRVRAGTLTVEAAQLDPTAMGDGWTRVTGGLKSGQLAIEFIDDFAAGEVDATLWPLFGTVVPFEVRPTADAVGVGNPSYTGEVFIAQHVVGGSIGELAAKSVTYPTSGPVARATA